MTGTVLMLGECAQPMDKLAPGVEDMIPGYDHFARVCLEPIPDHVARDTDGRRPNHNYTRGNTRKSNQPSAEVYHMSSHMPITYDNYCYEDNEYQQAYSLDFRQINTEARGNNKFYATLKPSNKNDFFMT